MAAGGLLPVGSVAEGEAGLASGFGRRVNARQITIAKINRATSDLTFESSVINVVNQVVATGIKAILNFSPGTLRAPKGVKLKSVDLTVSLESLSFYLAQKEE